MMSSSTPRRCSSDVWLFFKKGLDNKTATCQKCGSSYSYKNSTTSLISHVKKHHQEDLLKKKSEMRKSQEKIQKLQTDHTNRQKEAENQLILALCSGAVPFKFTENKFFQSFCSILDPNFRIPSADTVVRRLEENADRYRERQKDRLATVEKVWISLDGWEFRGQTIYGYYAYYVDEFFERRNALLGVYRLKGRATAQNVGRLSVKVLMSFNITMDKVMGIVSDAGSNLKSYARLNDTYHIHCQSHSLSLVIEGASKTAKLIKPIEKINRFASFLSRSKFEAEEFKGRSSALHIPGRIPLPFSPTRWGGVVMLVEAFFAHRPAMSNSPEFQDYLLSKDEEEELQKFLVAVKPFFSALTKAESDSSFVSETYPQLVGLSEHAKSLPGQKSQLVLKIREQIAKRLDEATSNDFNMFSLIFDPRFAYLDNFLKSRTWSSIEDELKKYSDSMHVLNASSSSTATSPSSSQPSTSKRQKLSEDQTFDVVAEMLAKRAPAKAMRSIEVELLAYKSSVLSFRPDYARTDPLVWWKTYRSDFPIISTIATHFLSAPQSSAQVERLFSRCSHFTSSPKRNRIKGETLNNMLLACALAGLREREADPEEEPADDMDSGSQGDAEKSEDESEPPSARQSRSSSRCSSGSSTRNSSRDEFIEENDTDDAIRPAPAAVVNANESLTQVSTKEAVVPENNSLFSMSLK